MSNNKTFQFQLANKPEITYFIKLKKKKNIYIYI